jgi:hypothetical protein
MVGDWWRLVEGYLSLRVLQYEHQYNMYLGIFSLYPQ